MKTYNIDKIRNVALVGHSNCGKTTLTEALLYVTKVTNRMGKVEDGNTVSDFDKEEKDRQVSIGTSVIPIEFEDTKINFLDTPGYFDFVGEVYGGLRVASGAVVVIDASSGIEVGTEKVWKYLEQRNLPRVIVLNKMDKENVKFDVLLEELREKFGKKVVPFALPIGEGENFKGYVDIVDRQGRLIEDIDNVKIEVPEELADKVEELRGVLMESVAETDELLLDKFFNGEEFTYEEVSTGLKNAVLSGEVVPVIVSCATKAMGLKCMMHMIKEYLPNSADTGEVTGLVDGKTTPRKVTSTQPLSAFVFKTIVDPFVGKITLFKVMSGVMKKDSEVYNDFTRETERIGNIFFLRGKDQIETAEIVAGDIGATAKLMNFKTGDKASPIIYKGIDFPKPSYFMAISGKTKDSDEKVGVGLHRLNEEDPTFTIERNAETKELVIGGHGNIQLAVLANKLKNHFKVEVDLTNPKVAYRETIRGKSDVQGKHKKQSGGAGQYGDVHIRFEPSNVDFEFVDEVVGGAVPRNFIPAVEKGLRECLDKGVLAGCKVVNIKATLYDGSYHDVDSNETSFKMAASIAFKKGLQEAKPVILEPVAKVEIYVPDEYMGDIMGDMNKRRGKILGMEQQEDGTQKVLAEAPQAEMYTYAIDLKSMTQAKGSFEMEFLRYDEMPFNMAEKVIADYKARSDNN